MDGVDVGAGGGGGGFGSTAPSAAATHGPGGSTSSDGGSGDGGRVDRGVVGGLSSRDLNQSNGGHGSGHGSGRGGSGSGSYDDGGDSGKRGRSHTRKPREKLVSTALYREASDASKKQLASAVLAKTRVPRRSLSWVSHVPSVASSIRREDALNEGRRPSSAGRYLTDQSVSQVTSAVEAAALVEDAEACRGVELPSPKQSALSSATVAKDGVDPLASAISLAKAKDRTMNAAKSYRIKGGRIGRAEVLQKFMESGTGDQDTQEDLEVASRTKQCFTITPGSEFKALWDWCIVALIVYNAVMVPLQIAFAPVWASSSAFNVFDIFVDAMFSIDIVISLNTGFVDKWGSLVTNRGIILKRYARGMLIVDVLAVIPFQVVAPESDLTFTNLLKLPRLLRLGRLTKKMELLAAANAMRIVILLLGFALLAHLMACSWYFLGDQVYSCSITDSCLLTVENTWITTFLGPDPDEVSSSHKYIVSMFFSLTTMTTVGYGDIHPVNDFERIFACLMLIVASAAYAVIFGNVAVQIQEFDKTMNRYNAKADAISEFFKLHSLPNDLYTKTKKYVDSLWAMSRGIDHQAVLSELPVQLRSEIMLTLHKSLVERVPIFRSFSEASIRAIVVLLTPQVCLEGDFIMQEGEKALAMYFVYKGIVVIEKKVDAGSLDEEIVQLELEPGSFFGESALLSSSSVQRSQVNIFAATLCHLYVLSSGDFKQVMSDFPEYRQVLQDLETRRLEVAKFRKMAKPSRAAMAQPRRKSKSINFSALMGAARVKHLSNQAKKRLKAGDGPKRSKRSSVAPASSDNHDEPRALRELRRSSSLRRMSVTRGSLSSGGMATARRSSFFSSVAAGGVKGSITDRDGKSALPHNQAHIEKYEEPKGLSISEVAAVIIQREFRFRIRVGCLPKTKDRFSRIMVMSTTHIFEVEPWFKQLRILVAKQKVMTSKKQTVPIMVQSATREMKALQRKARAMRSQLQGKMDVIQKNQNKLMKTARKMMILLAVTKTPSPQEMPVAPGDRPITASRSFTATPGSLIRSTRTKSNQSIKTSGGATRKSTSPLEVIEAEEFDVEAAIRAPVERPRGSLAGPKATWMDSGTTGSKAASAFAGALLARHSTSPPDEENKDEKGGPKHGAML